MGNTFKSENKVLVYEVNGASTEHIGAGREEITVKNHWNDKDFIVLVVGDKEITVLADQLGRAIENAQNAHRF